MKTNGWNSWNGQVSVERRVDEENARKVLGLSGSVELEVNAIKSAFKRVAMERHPDKEKGSEAAFKELLNAYDYLLALAEIKSATK